MKCWQRGYEIADIPGCNSAGQAYGTDYCYDENYQIPMDYSGSPYFLDTVGTRSFSCKPDRSVKAIEIKLITDNSLALADGQKKKNKKTQVDVTPAPPGGYGQSLALQKILKLAKGGEGDSSPPPSVQLNSVSTSNILDVYLAVLLRE